MNKCIKTDTPLSTPLPSSGPNLPSLTKNTTKVSGLSSKTFAPDFLLSERKVEEKIGGGIKKDPKPLSVRKKEFAEFLKEVEAKEEKGIYVPSDYIQTEYDLTVLNTCGFYTDESQYK